MLSMLLAMALSETRPYSIETFHVRPEGEPSGTEQRFGSGAYQYRAVRRGIN
jgi:hypothetical protein